MNYTKIYDSLIKSRLLSSRLKKNDGSLEKHHIIPKCLGGNNDITNLVLLTPREHYVAHWLLYKIHTGKIKAKMAYAFFSMCKRNSNQKRYITSRMYEYAKLAMSKSCTGDNHPNKGKNIWSSEDKLTISARMQGINNHRYGKEPWNKGLTKETSDIIVKAKKKELETKRLNFVSNTKERKFNLKAKITVATVKEPVLITCPHCGFIGHGGSFFRWHLNNCKLSPNYIKPTLSEETLEKMSTSAKNRKRFPSFKGFTHSKEAKEKISTASRGQKRGLMTEEHRQKISSSQKGKTYEEKFGVEKATELKKKRSEEGKLRKGSTGKIPSEVTRKKMSESGKEKVPNDVVETLIYLYTQKQKPVIKHIAKEIGLSVWIVNRLLKEQGLI